MDDERLHIETTDAAGEVVAIVSGDLDLVTADRAKRSLSQLIDDKPESLRLDLSALSFIDSTGLGALVAVHHHAATTGVPMTLTGVSSQVRRVMEITRLDELFDIR